MANSKEITQIPVPQKWETSVSRGDNATVRSIESTGHAIEEAIREGAKLISPFYTAIPESGDPNTQAIFHGDLRLIFDYSLTPNPNLWVQHVINGLELEKYQNDKNSNYDGFSTPDGARGEAIKLAQDAARFLIDNWHLQPTWLKYYICAPLEQIHIVVPAILFGAGNGSAILPSIYFNMVRRIYKFINNNNGFASKAMSRLLNLYPSFDSATQSSLKTHKNYPCILLPFAVTNEQIASREVGWDKLKNLTPELLGDGIFEECLVDKVEMPNYLTALTAFYLSYNQDGQKNSKLINPVRIWECHAIRVCWYNHKHFQEPLYRISQIFQDLIISTHPSNTHSTRPNETRRTPFLIMRDCACKDFKKFIDCGCDCEVASPIELALNPDLHIKRANKPRTANGHPNRNFYSDYDLLYHSKIDNNGEGTDTIVGVAMQVTHLVTRGNQLQVLQINIPNRATLFLPVKGFKHFKEIDSRFLSLPKFIHPSLSNNTNLLRLFYNYLIAKKTHTNEPIELVKFSGWSEVFGNGQLFYIQHRKQIFYKLLQGALVSITNKETDLSFVPAESGTIPHIESAWLVFAVCLAFSAYLLPFSKLSGAGFFFSGEDVQRITNMAGLMCADIGITKYINSPNQTDNTIHWTKAAKSHEEIKILFNHRLLKLDRIETLKPAKLKQTISNLLSGSGVSKKNNLNSYPKKQPKSVKNVGASIFPLRPGLIFVTTREHPKPASNSARQIDINVGIQPLSPSDRKLIYQYSELPLQSLTLTPGQTFANKLVQLFLPTTNKCNITNKINESMVNFLNEVSPGGESVISIVADRFALVAAAGELASKMGLLQNTREDISEKIQWCYHEWLRQYMLKHSKVGEDSIIENLKKVIEKNKNRITSDKSEATTEDHSLLAPFGYLFEKDGQSYLLCLSESLPREIKKSNSLKRMLSDRGVLLRKETDKAFASVRWIPKLKKSIHGYLLNLDKLKIKL